MSVLNNSIIKNLSILVSGTAIAQLVIIGFQIVLRRIFTPDIFGAFSVYMSVVSIMVAVASLRYEQSIVIPKDNRDGYVLTQVSVLISVIIVLLFSVFLFIANDLFLKWIGLTLEYRQWLVFLPISILVFSVYQSISYFLIRLKRFRLVSTNKIIRRLSEGTFQSGIGVYFSSIGLVLGDILGNVVIIIHSIIRLRGEYLTIKLNRNRVKELMLRYKSFPIKSTLPSLANTLSSMLPIILVSRFFSSETTGYFDLARVVLVMPLSLISASLSQVLLQRFSEMRNNGSAVKKEMLGIFMLLFIVSVLFVVVIKFFGVYLFSFVFGEQWGNSGHFAEILVYAFAIKFIISPFNSSFIAFEKIGIFSIWQMLYFSLIVSLFFIHFNSIYTFLYTYMIVEIVAYVIVAILNLSILYKYDSNIKMISDE
jgi:O-antigen/teichoic acid export membrane protein